MKERLKKKLDYFEWLKPDFAPRCRRLTPVLDCSCHVDTYFKNTIFMDNCKCWSRKEDKVTWLWSGSILHCMEEGGVEKSAIEGL
jgi:hypothetical protein